MKYNTAIKHAAKVVSKSDARPVLQGAYHKDSEIIATDGHRLIKVSIDKMKFEEHILNLKTDEIIEGIYPNTERLLADNFLYTTSVLAEDLKVIKEILKLYKSLKADYIQISYMEKRLVLKGHWNDTEVKEKHKALSVELEISNEVECKMDSNYYYDIKYFADMIDCLIDTKENAEFCFNSNKSPIEIRTEGLTYLLMPIRVY